jgi:glyoxylase-like metal-dependent hydrolase (beta-lactamase superfamily II)
MDDIKQISRRKWLARVALGGFAVWTEVNFGFGRRGWAVAIGNADSDGIAHAQTKTAAQLHRVNLGFVSAYVLVRGKEAAVVDTGTAGNGAKIGEVVRSAGVGWDAIHHVILTHHHPDHQGSIGEVLSSAAKATAYAGAADIPQIKSPRPLKAVADNDEVFGLRIIATPGHTPGHVCVFDPAGSLLILGDAMNNMNNSLSGPNPQYTADMAEAHGSVKKLPKLKFERAVFGHGDPIDKAAAQAIAKLAGTL